MGELYSDHSFRISGSRLKIHTVTEDHVTTRYGMIVSTVLLIIIGDSGSTVLRFKFRRANVATGGVTYQPGTNLAALPAPDI